MVTIKDISKKSGYSVTTVSKALNDYQDIPQKTKDKILKLCDEMGYVPNLSARSLVNKKSYTIGVIFEENTGLGLQHPLFSNILESFKNEVEKSGYDIMFLSKSMGHNKGSYYQHCLRKQVDGVLVVCAEYDSKEMNELYEGTIPTVIIDFVHGNALSITSNNELGVKQAVRYLKDLGHTKIAHIHGSKQTYIGDLRFSFFREMMAYYELDYTEDYIVDGGFFSKEDGYNAMRKLLKLKELPTAVFCDSDMIAIGAIQAINQAHLKVPEDISIIGFDGIDIGQIFSPRLTTIRQDSQKMGRIAASNILNMIKDKLYNHADTITVDTYLITGETTRVLR